MSKESDNLERDRAHSKELRSLRALFNIRGDTKLHMPIARLYNTLNKTQRYK